MVVRGAALMYGPLWAYDGAVMSHYCLTLVELLAEETWLRYHRPGATPRRIVLFRPCKQHVGNWELDPWRDNVAYARELFWPGKDSEGGT